MAPSRIDTPPSQADSSSEKRLPASRPKLYLLEHFPPAVVKHAQTLFDAILPSDPQSQRWKDDAEAIVVRELTVSRQDIMAAQKLRAIGKQGTGIDIIDQEACNEGGIPILNTPGLNAQSVAELVLALTMAVARQLRPIVSRQAAGEEVRKEHCCGTTLFGKPIGIVGMGAIGTAVARMFHGAFGSTVYACDPFAPADAWSDTPHVRVDDLEEMLPHVEMLTLHVPLNAKTRGMVRMQHLQQMRSSAILINVARGGIVDEDELAEALEQGLLFGAGLDCHEVEPPTLQRYGRLWATNRVASTPHIGATTADTPIATAPAAIDHVYRYLTSPASWGDVLVVRPLRRRLCSRMRRPLAPMQYLHAMLTFEQCGTALRLAMVHRLYRQDHLASLPVSERAHRCRLWWIVYMQERRLAAAIGQPVTVEDYMITAEMPTPVPGFSSPVGLALLTNYTYDQSLLESAQ